MKTLFKVALVAVSMLFIGNFAQAQSKIGYISFQALITQMTEYKTVMDQINLYQKDFIDQGTVMNNTYQKAIQDYQAKVNSMTDAQKTAKQAELQDMQKRLQEFQNDAQQKVEAKSNELSKPLIDKARAAITAVSKEKGYNYVLDSSQITLIVSPDGDDLMAAVKLKLGLK